MPPFYVKCRNKGCDNTYRGEGCTKEQFSHQIEIDGWVDGECPDCVESKGMEDSVIQIPLPSGYFTASVPGKITPAEWRTIRDMIGLFADSHNETRDDGD